jgi:hypothetical protein
LCYQAAQVSAMARAVGKEHELMLGMEP